MLRYLVALCLLALAAPAAEAKKVTIKWHGQSFFEITSGDGATLVTDPHNLEAYGRRAVEADVVLISHLHIDHAIPVQVTNLDKAKVIPGLKNKSGIRGERRKDEFNAVDEKVKGFHIRSVPSYHDNMQGMERGKNTIFVIDVDGLRIVHLGDLGHKLTKTQLSKLGKVDVLMVPVGGVYTINGDEAKEVVAQIKPRRYVIPMHYGTKVYDLLLTEEEFLDGQPAKLVQRLDTNELVVDADAVPRKDPFIALLHYDSKKEKEKDKD